MQTPPQNAEQLKHAAMLAEGEATLLQIKIQAAQRRAKAERRLVRAIVLKVFGGQLDEGTTKLLENWMSTHKAEDQASSDCAGLDLKKLQGQAALLHAMHGLQKEHESKVLLGGGAGGGPAKVYVPGT